MLVMSRAVSNFGILFLKTLWFCEFLEGEVPFNLCDRWRLLYRHFYIEEIHQTPHSDKRFKKWRGKLKKIGCELSIITLKGHCTSELWDGSRYSKESEQNKPSSRYRSLLTSRPFQRHEPDINKKMFNAWFQSFIEMRCC